MKKCFLQAQTFMVLTILFFVTSCNAQVKKDLPEESNSESRTITARQSKLVRTQGTNPSDNVRSGMQDEAGNIWFGTTGEGVYRYDGRSFTQFTVKDGLKSNFVWSVLEDKTGRIWFGTAEGIFRLMQPRTIPVREMKYSISCRTKMA